MNIESRLHSWPVALAVDFSASSWTPLVDPFGSGLLLPVAMKIVEEFPKPLKDSPCVELFLANVCREGHAVRTPSSPLAAKRPLTLLLPPLLPQPAVLRLVTIPSLFMLSCGGTVTRYKGRLGGT